MITNLKVKPVLTDFAFACTYDTFEEAVDPSNFAERYRRAKEDNKTLHKLKIVDFKIYMNRVVCFLSDETLLEISTHRDRGDWRILSKDRREQEPQDYAEEVELTIDDDS